jgi:inward rectifier potassium channel
MKQAKDPGLGTTYQKSVKRMLNENGTFNIQRVGMVTGYKDIYKYLVDLPTWKFVVFLTVAFIFLNTLFTTGYILIGTSELQGIPKEQHPYIAAFYFSAQTFTTVGYGAIAPKGNGASLLAAIEAFVGLVTFSIATGLIYGRFSRPSAKIAFSKNVILSPYKNGQALMFKMVNQRNSVLLNTRVNVMISLSHKEHHASTYIRRYYNLPLEADYVRYFPLTWTIVHEINEESPLFGLSLQDILEQGTEVLILVEAFDETFSQMVLQKHSYANDQWQENVRFKRNFRADDSGKIVLNIHELHELEPV